MPQNMALPILRNEVTKIRSNPHICYCRPFIPPALDGETFEENESFAIDELFPNRFKESC